MGLQGNVLTVLRPNSIVLKLVGVLQLGYFMLSPAKLVQSRIPSQECTQAPCASSRSPSRFVKAKCKRHINQMALRVEGGPLPTEAADPPLSVISFQYYA